MIDPSPENQAFAKAQADFLPSPDGRGQNKYGKSERI